jgi:hypothetical protein
MKHTPGPWHVVKVPGGNPTIKGSDGHSVACLGNNRKRTTEEQWANARLMAAAPQLLQALKDLLPYHMARSPGADLCYSKAAHIIALIDDAIHTY